MKSKKSDVAILNEAISDMEKTIIDILNYRNESNHDSSIEGEKRCRSLLAILRRRISAIK